MEKRESTREGGGSIRSRDRVPVKMTSPTTLRCARFAGFFVSLVNTVVLLTNSTFDGHPARSDGHSSEKLVFPPMRRPPLLPDRPTVTRVCSRTSPGPHKRRAPARARDLRSPPRQRIRQSRPGCRPGKKLVVIEDARIQHVLQPGRIEVDAEECDVLA